MSAPALQLYGYQRRWFLDRRRFKLGKFARQTGKTFTTTLEIVDDCFEVESKGGRTLWVILSRGERQSREAMNTVAMHCRAYSIAIDEIEAEFRGDDKETYRQLEIRLPGGSRIIGLPANPDTARGFSGNVFLDEFAFHKDSRAIWKALFPIISAGFKLRVTSTPNGKSNKFYELDTGDSAAWSRHVVDIYQAVAEGLPRDVDELRAGLDDDDAWAQEYELHYLDEASAWLSYDLINSVEHEQAGDPQRFAGGRTYIGNDIAARNDLWVAWVWEEVGDVLWTRELLVRRRISFAEQDHLLDGLVERYRPARVAMDQTGMGEKPVEDAKRRYGELRVEGVLFTGPAKQHMATIAKQRFEDRKVRIPMGDPKVRADLHSLRKITTPAGNIRFDVDGGDGHADRAWGGFLGLYAADAGGFEIDYQSAGPRPSLRLADSAYGNPPARATDIGWGTIPGGNDTGGF